MAFGFSTPCPELLSGRRVMCHTVVLADIANAGAVYVADEGEVIVDDDLVTARSFANMEGYFWAIVAAAEERRVVVSDDRDVKFWASRGDFVFCPLVKRYPKVAGLPA